MIGFLRGVIISKQPPFLLLDVGGTGYEIEAPMTTFYALPKAGSEAQIYTHLAVREDAHLLFGFATVTERQLFRHLIKINGVGAKLALTILSGITADEFAQCINNNDTLRLTALPGIGKKTAARLIIEMRDRLQDFNYETERTDVTVQPQTSPIAEATNALVSLGFKSAEASRLVAKVAAQGAVDDSEELIRQALKQAVQ